MPKPTRNWFRRIGRVILYGLLLIPLAATVSLSGADLAADRSFNAAVDQWQIHPEFRAIAMDYSTRGSAAMRTRLFHIPAKRVILALRSIPGLPREYAVNPTSLQHYEDFSKGPLSAYLHLCGEQDVHDMAGIFVEAGRRTGRGDADLRHVLDGFKMDFPVVYDQGALQSVSDVLRDTDAAAGFKFQENIGPRLLAPIASLAADLHFPADPNDMTADQQRVVFERLDGYVHAQDEELWRTKQLNDFCSGVWAQVYGPPYKTATVPIVMMHDVGEIALIVILGILAFRGIPRRKETAPKVDAPILPGT
jgi:hypothetical protein